MADFKKLHVWRKAHALSLNVHRVAPRIRGTGAANLRNQILRAASSIPTNIVEGRARNSPRDFARFLRIALASTSELEYHLIMARDQRFLTRAECITLLAQTIEVRKMLFGLLRKLADDERAAAR